jgi:sterol desaturase/sphingolipid hydroxylase (fatty acid hydroxylase superfamily)
VGLRHGINGSVVLGGVYFSLALALGGLERVLPFEREWIRSDGQITHDVVFTLTGTFLPGALADGLVLACTVGVAQWLARHVGSSLWPHDWPAAARIVLVLLVGDFGAYWGHRAFHNVASLWPYHAVHHSVPRLWFLNTGRIHPVDSALMMVFSMPPLYLLGAPDDMVVWLFSFTTFVGMLSHCNVDLRCGALDWLFCTPGVHRWHHSRLLGESNNNYGEITMVWDVLFRTHYRQQRRPPRDIGTSTPMPAGILGQFMAPVRLSWRAAADRSAPSAAYAKHFALYRIPGLSARAVTAIAGITDSRPCQWPRRSSLRPSLKVLCRSSSLAADQPSGSSQDERRPQRSLI